MQAAVRGYGRLVLGLGAILYGAVDLIWHDASAWRQVAPLAHWPAGLLLGLFLFMAAVELAGGILLLTPPARAGAWMLVAAYIVATLLTLPDVMLHPAVFNSWGNLGEQLSRLAGVVLVLALTRAIPPALGRAAYWAFAACVVTFMGEQWAYFPPTVALVPKWIPLGQAFWAVATTVAFGLAAAALLARRAALPAARLLTAMLLVFAVAVWAPIVAAHPHALGNWTEMAETVSIAGAAWIASDWLATRRGHDAARAAAS